MIHFALAIVLANSTGLLGTMPMELPPMYDPTQLMFTWAGTDAAPIRVPGEAGGT